MQLTPRYGDAGFVRFDLPMEDPGPALVQQRRRLASTLATLDDEQWGSPSRCELWSVQDVVTHLVSTNGFWTVSIGAALAGTPTRYLATFDPVASPAELVNAAGPQRPAEVLEQYVSTVDALADAVARVDHEDWNLPGEAPPGHVPLRGVALHALWDAWVHERDIVLPLGLEPAVDVAEVGACLAYAAALSPALALANGSTGRGAIDVEVTDPTDRFVVEVDGSIVIRGGEPPAGALQLRGDAVALLEALSHRAPLPCPVPDEHRWLLAGLAEVFDLDP